jgi:hypothetical protein
MKSNNVNNENRMSTRETPAQHTLNEGNTNIQHNQNNMEHINRDQHQQNNNIINITERGSHIENRGEPDIRRTTQDNNNPEPEYEYNNEENIQEDEILQDEDNTLEEEITQEEDNTYIDEDNQNEEEEEIPLRELENEERGDSVYSKYKDTARFYYNNANSFRAPKLDKWKATLDTMEEFKCDFFGFVELA